MNEYDRHIEHSEIFENNLESRALNKQIPTDEIVENKINNEKLREAIQELPKIQRERLKKYYFENKTFEEIAEEEKQKQQGLPVQAGTLFSEKFMRRGGKLTGNEEDE